MALEIFTIARLDELLAQVTTIEELDKVQALWELSKKAEKLAALKDLRNNTVEMLILVDKMGEHIASLKKNSGLIPGQLADDMIGEINEIHAKFHDGDALRKTFASTDTIIEIIKDEVMVPGSDQLVDLPNTQTILDTPEPSPNTKFVALADEYIRFFDGAGFRTTHEKKIKDMAVRALGFKDKYEAVGTPLGIPWWFVAAIHQMESSYNFGRHLHNGDSLKNRTVRVPAGRPLAGGLPFTWTQSATDSLIHQRLDNLSDWSLPRALWRLERYNGLGYRARGVPTPYLWSFSTIYLRGKYVKDGKFDGNATSAQCGAAVMLKSLYLDGHIMLKSDLANEPGQEVPDVSDPDNPAPAPSTDTSAGFSHPFEQFFAENLGDMKHFTWREFLFKGNKHAQNGLNADPSEDLWPHIVPIARVLDKLRGEYGKPIRLTSIYRSPAYNASLSGSASRSQHMAFRAIDFQVVGEGNPKEWAAKLKQYRDDGLFSGGVGIYGSFVHIDARGSNVNW